MKILFDTHTFLWFIQGDPTLPESTIHAIEKSENEVFFSAASYWELCIKISIGKLKLEGSWQQTIEHALLENSIAWLDIKKSHMEWIVHMPMHHRDPFDRLLVSQALCEDLHFCTVDRAMEEYGVRLL